MRWGSSLDLFYGLAGSLSHGHQAAARRDAPWRNGPAQKHRQRHLQNFVVKPNFRIWDVKNAKDLMNLLAELGLGEYGTAIA